MTSTDPGRAPASGPSHARPRADEAVPAGTSGADEVGAQTAPDAPPAVHAGDAPRAVHADDALAVRGDDPLPPAGDTEADAVAEGDEHNRKSFWRELPVLVLVALVLAFLIKTFLVQAFFVPSESMENTLLVGDRVLVNKLAYRFGEIERGDVVVFDGRGSFEPKRVTEEEGTSIGSVLRAVASSFGLAPGTESDYIKRVIGVGGDHVVCCDDDGLMTVNGTALDPEDYLFPGDVPSVSPFDITVPEGRLWVMGDHRSRSEDSRAHTGAPGGGTVSEDRVIGRAFVKVWPIGRWDTMPRPDVFDDVAEPVPSGG